MKDVLISVVNGNTQGYIYECVESIFNITRGITYDIVVIDNATGEGDLGSLENKGVEVIYNDKSIGFAENHSQVLNKLAGYRYLFIFNDDAYLKTNAIAEMVHVLDAEEDTVIAGCRISEPDGDLQPSIASFPKLDYFIRNVLGIDNKHGEKYPSLFTDGIDYEATQYIDWVSGCSMLIKKEFIDNYGFMDAGYYMFLEDADICRKAWNEGYKVKYISEAEIVHHGGASSKNSKKIIKPWLFVETQRSRLRFLKKEMISRYLIYLIFINTFVLLKIFKNALHGDLAWSKEVISILPKRPLL